MCNDYIHLIFSSSHDYHEYDLFFILIQFIIKYLVNYLIHFTLFLKKKYIFIPWFINYFYLTLVCSIKYYIKIK